MIDVCKVDIAACWYHRNIKLIALESSALLIYQFNLLRVRWMPPSSWQLRLEVSTRDIFMVLELGVRTDGISQNIVAIEAVQHLGLNIE